MVSTVSDPLYDHRFGRGPANPVRKMRVGMAYRCAPLVTGPVRRAQASAWGSAAAGGDTRVSLA
eukprot:7390839-Prymnesium_polylepis.3